MFKYSFDSKEAAILNKEIFATIYHAACEKSMEIAKERTVNIQDLKNRINDINEHT